jgi:hypothetical protein
MSQMSDHAIKTKRKPVTVISFAVGVLLFLPAFLCHAQSGDTTIVVVETRIYPYYKFIQYYPQARLSLYFGEVEVHTTGNQVWYPALKEWNDEVNRPMYMHPDSLYAHSGTHPDTVFVGDTLQYYWSLDAEPDVVVTDPIEFQVTGTLIYYLDLVNTKDGTSITVDSMGLRPFNTQEEYLHAIISPYNHENTSFQYNDTAIVKKRLIPPLGSDSVSYPLELVIRHAFSAPDTTIFPPMRWDMHTLEPVSKYSQQRRDFLAAELSRLLDSILTAKKGRVISPEDAMIRDIKVENSVIHMLLAEHNYEQLNISVYTLLGQKVHTTVVDNIQRGVRLNLSGSPAGQYFIAISSEGKFIETTKISIVN